MLLDFWLHPDQFEKQDLSQSYNAIPYEAVPFQFVTIITSPSASMIETPSEMCTNGTLRIKVCLHSITLGWEFWVDCV